MQTDPRFVLQESTINPGYFHVWDVLDQAYRLMDDTFERAAKFAAALNKEA